MGNKIKAAFLTGPKEINISEIQTPQPGDGEVLIKPMLTAICGSDLSFFAGHRMPPAFPVILGHEVVGEVIALGNGVSKVSLNQRVIVEPNYQCGKCSFCQTGHGNICPNKISLGVTIPGCFAEQFVAPAEFCWVIPNSISNENAVTIEPLTVSLHALWNSGVKLGDTITVIGCGATGLLLIHAAVAQGARVIAHDKAESKLDMACRLGAEVFPAREVAELWKSEGVTTIFECAGVSATVEMAIKYAPRGSQIILMGLSTMMATFEPLRFVREGLRVSGSIIYDHPGDFAKAISLVEKKMLSPESIVSKKILFSNIQEAMQIASTGETGKVILVMG